MPGHSVETVAEAEAPKLPSLGTFGPHPGMHWGVVRACLPRHPGPSETPPWGVAWNSAGPPRQPFPLRPPLCPPLQRQKGRPSRRRDLALPYDALPTKLVDSLNGKVNTRLFLVRRPPPREWVWGPFEGGGVQSGVPVMGFGAKHQFFLFYQTPYDGPNFGGGNCGRFPHTSRTGPAPRGGTTPLGGSNRSLVKPMSRATCRMR